MAPGFNCSAASLLCCEDGLSDDECGSYFSSPVSVSFAAKLELDDSCNVEAAVTDLVDREIDHLPAQDYLQKYDNKLLDPGSRQKAVDWLFKVRAFYNFGPLTTVLSVNYLDRFLSLHLLPTGKSWMMQLLSVACLSLAAKMEETDVPLLLDLQVSPEFLFEPRTIQRMELLVLSTLGWRLSSVTPFSYIDYFLRKLDLAGNIRPIVCNRIGELILCAVQDMKFLYHKPSSIAAAAVLCAIKETCNLQLSEIKKTLWSVLPHHTHDGLERCFVLMSDLYLAQACIPSESRSCGVSVPRSPMGVLDASFSCDSESTYKSVGSDPSDQISSPAPKKRKIDDFCSSLKVCAA